MYTNKYLKIIVISALTLIVFSACTKDEDTENTVEQTTKDTTYPYIYQVPDQIDDGWETASVDSVGLDKLILEDLVNKIQTDKYSEVHSVLIVKDGKLVFEEYFPGHDFYYLGNNFHGPLVNFNQNTLHNTHSATKSIVSMLTGIAISKGLLNSVKDTVFDFFQSYSYLLNEQKKNIIIEHLLTMSSGFAWNEWSVPPGDPDYDTYLFNISSDPVYYILSKPIVSEPGSTFNYNGATVDLLGEIIKNASGLRVDLFAERYLFDQLGIVNYSWPSLPSGLMVCHGDIQMLPRDMAKIGFLYLNNGYWNDNKIISTYWVLNSTQKQMELPYLTWADDYGYLWWLKTYYYEGEAFESIKAIGWGGQEIFIIPELEMVVVFTGANYVSDPPCDEILNYYILSAIN